MNKKTVNRTRQSRHRGKRKEIHPEYNGTKEILNRFFDNITKVETKRGFLPTRYEIFKQNRSELYERWVEANRVSEILKDIKAKEILESLPPESASMNKMLVYLGLVESLGNALANMVLMLLIANGQEIHTRSPPIRHVKCLDELEDLDMSNKMKHLDSEGLVVFKDILNQSIRNIVAHLKFTIDKQGVIRDKGNSLIKIDDDISRFWSGVYALWMVFEEIGFMNWLREDDRSMTAKEGRKTPSEYWDYVRERDRRKKQP
jgi:hypothetical protein